MAPTHTHHYVLYSPTIQRFVCHPPHWYPDALDWIQTPFLDKAEHFFYREYGEQAKMLILQEAYQRLRLGIATKDSVWFTWLNEPLEVREVTVISVLLPK